MKPITTFLAALLIAALSFTAFAQTDTKDAERNDTTRTGTSIDTLAMSTPSGTVLTYLQGRVAKNTGAACYDHTANTTESYTCLVQALKTSGLDQTLTTTKNVTVFAPNDEAFKQLAATMTPEDFTRFLNNKEQLTALLNYHVLPKAYTLENLSIEAGTPSVSKKTLQGSDITLNFTDQNGSNAVVGLGNNTFVDAATVRTDNGTVIGIDRVLSVPSESPNS